LSEESRQTESEKPQAKGEFSAKAVLRPQGYPPQGRRAHLCSAGHVSANHSDKPTIHKEEI